MKEFIVDIKDSNISSIVAKLIANERDDSDQIDFYLAYEEASELNEVSE